MKRYIALDLHRLREHQLTPTEWVTLDLLTIPTISLERALGLSKSKIQTLLKHLHHKRWIDETYQLTPQAYELLGYERPSSTSTMIPSPSSSPLSKELLSESLPAIRPQVTPITPSTTTNEEADRIVRHFIDERQAIQPDYDITLSSRKVKMDPFYQMRLHLAQNTHQRSAEKYHAMIRWIFQSGSKEAEFWRKSIMTIDGLITHYDRVEMAAMGNTEDIAFKKKVQTRIEMMRKRGHSDEEIAQEIRRMEEKR